jgi:hypothetical protein
MSCWYDAVMTRTTVSIDDDILAAAKALARAEGRSVGAVISDLARRGLRPGLTSTRKGGVPVFSVPEDAGPLTIEDVARALDEHR